jgi:hypothetical protein
MKILLLSCNTGEGHNSAGKALKKYFEENGDECYMADAIAFRSETISKIVAEGHVFIYTKTPKFFDVFYNGAEMFAKTETSGHDSVLFKLLLVELTLADYHGWSAHEDALESLAFHDGKGGNYFNGYKRKYRDYGKHKRYTVICDGEGSKLG